MNEQVIHMILEGIRDTLYMTLSSVVIGYAFGLPFGILLYTTGKNGLLPNRLVYRIGDFVQSYGSTATIVPLVVCAAPYIARVVESSLNEVDTGVIEAAKAMGASSFQIVTKVLLPEARTSLISGFTITTGLLLGYSAMSGTVGGGGLGDIAVRYGYYRWQADIMIITVLLLIVIFQIIQNIGMRIASQLDHRKRKES